jgi:cell fate regulator YaaT (PSP1 superfamily)
MADIIQVALRGTRKEFFLNSRNLWLKLRDPVIVQTEHGEAFGSVFLKDQTLVQLKRPGTVTREIIRKAEEEDLDQEDHNRDREHEAFEYCKERIESRDLKMDLGDVEVAFSGHRITFYFSAEHRVDFRELVKDLAARFRTRIELRQIGVRDQAKRLDGCGPCGRAFCCSTWLKEFHPVTLKMAREQQLALNPSKISGACGRLMCCLAYELTQYRDSQGRLPSPGLQMRTGQGIVTVIRTETYQEAVWIRDDEGGEHRIAYADLPPGPYHKCGDCNCGKRSKEGPKNGGSGGAPPEDETPPDAWADPPPAS